MRAIKLLLGLLGILISTTLSAKTISGVVTDESNLAIPGVSIVIKGTTNGTSTGIDGKYTIEVEKGDILIYSFVGLISQEIEVKDQTVINVIMRAEQISVDEVIVVGYGKKTKQSFSSSVAGIKIRGKSSRRGKRNAVAFCQYEMMPTINYNTEGYSTINENNYKNAVESPVSTFSIDVDAASYSNVRRFLTNGEKPPIDAVRIEEMINYFNYSYEQPKGEHPFAIHHEIAECPWNNDNLLLHIGLQGKKIETENLPASNLVFLLDVSGSMNSPNKLPLLKKAFKLLVNELRPEDKVAIVVYAGSSGLVLPSTNGNEKEKILNALNKLNAGGSTAGAAGLELAYKTARENFIDGGNNRIILATDGDFNVGISSNAEMERLIEKERNNGVFISVLGFGMGNYKDDKMEIIADKGNGNYSYIDNILEAKKVLVNEFGGTLHTIAKDVKIQIEFNPAIVEEYRLIGYENRMLNKEDFDDDKKDAGELGSGHNVTALYEIKLAKRTKKDQNLKYQDTKLNAKALSKDEIATVKFRYKNPKGRKSILITEEIPMNVSSEQTLSENFQFSAAVAGFGLLLRKSKHKGNCNYKMLIDLAQNSKGKDEEGYRGEFIRLMKLAKHL
ncbi:VWA domain-containing protein [Marinifilum sp. D714]|uniref:vWA domain-containing protein n=1 Tax=Marinifilum sp. D714 TaxID=2937523 RepID=UPI0027C8B66F|nr:VWA domain-containing protein [Marinifilum sp. D714]MDQ2179462.1 von Willebrand factor type A domain-containing protein [Marinifilum sp. D714]